MLHTFVVNDMAELWYHGICAGADLLWDFPDADLAVITATNEELLIIPDRGRDAGYCVMVFPIVVHESKQNRAADL